MANNENEKPLTGHEPAYERGLREARANMPKILDRETGVERDVFSPVPPEKKLIGRPGDALLEKLGRKKPAGAPKAVGALKYETPAWLSQGFDQAGIVSVNLGDLDEVAKLMDVVAAHEKKHAISLIIDRKTGELTIFTTGEEPKLTKEEMEIVSEHVKMVCAYTLPELGIKKPEAKAEKSPAKPKKEASTKKPTTTKKTSSAKKKTAPKKAKKDS